MDFAAGMDSIMFLLFVSAVVGLLPFAAAVWALIVRGRLQRGQEELLTKLAAIERWMRARDNQI